MPAVEYPRRQVDRGRAFREGRVCRAGRRAPAGAVRRPGPRAARRPAAAGRTPAPPRQPAAASRISLAAATCMSRGSGTPFFTARTSAITLTAISGGVLLPM